VSSSQLCYRGSKILRERQDHLSVITDFNMMEIMGVELPGQFRALHQKRPRNDGSRSLPLTQQGFEHWIGLRGGKSSSFCVLVEKVRMLLDEAVRSTISRIN